MKINEIGYKWAYNPGARQTTTHLMLHHAAANARAETIHSWHLNNGWAGIAYHYYVRKDGEIYRGRPENWSGGHTTNWNYCSIGICFEGNFESDEMPSVQRRAGSALVADIMKRYPGIIVGKHSAYNSTACPGRKFPFDEIVRGKMEEPAESNAEENNLPSAWATEACELAVSSGVFQGDGSGNYNWQEPLSREMMAVILGRLKLIG